MRTRTKLAIAASSMLVLGAGLVAVVMKTPLLLADLRTEPLGDAEQGRATLHRAQAAHGGRDAWLDHEWVELELDGDVPFLPARLGFGGVDERASVWLRFDPRQYGVATLRVDGETHAIDTRSDRDGLGLLADSLRHLWELPFAMESADVIAALPDREGQERVFASWGTDAPQMDVDQYVLWTDPAQHLVRRFDSTGRAIAPFIVARVMYEGYRTIDGFELPGRVTIYDEEDAVVHRWTLVAARLGPARSEAVTASRR